MTQPCMPHHHKLQTPAELLRDGTLAPCPEVNSSDWLSSLFPKFVAIYVGAVMSFQVSETLGMRRCAFILTVAC